MLTGSCLCGGVRFEIAGDGTLGTLLPPGGLVLSWPFPGRAGEARVNGAPAAIEPNGTLTLRTLPATVDLLPLGARASGPPLRARRPRTQRAVTQSLEGKGF